MTKGRQKLRICVAGSAGGHINQLLRLSSGWRGHNTFFVTTKKVVQEKLQQYGKVYIVGECNRQRPFMCIIVLLRCIRIIFKEHPDVVISTGAAPGVMLCFISKILGGKIVWIDSIANVERLSLSGRLVRPFADLFLTQWSTVANEYSKVEFVGVVI